MIRFVTLFIYLFATNVSAQNRGEIRIMTYNTENLFDTEDDPLTADDDYTPAGRLYWTKEKYHHKLFNIYKVITALGGWQPPEIIGLVEIENRRVLNDLLTITPLSKYNYAIAHYESPDPRGIDVALLFQSDKFKLLDKEPICIDFAGSPERKTRDILFVKLLYKNIDTLYLFVNHWPSRRGGEIETEDLRFEAALKLRHKIDLVLTAIPSAKIIVMGDFNDEPSDQSMTNYLKAESVFNQTITNHLYNLTFQMLKTTGKGTLYYKGQWSVLDQIIVSGSLIISKRGIYTKPTDIHIFTADFMIQTDQKNLGIKPLPTYSGPRYVGGYSDHLPVYLDLYLKN
ncbi:MAG TPA: endonuclease/exonuclease/phosphatase family protein [Bacteroidales bacterium]